MQSVGTKRPGRRPLRQHVYRNARKYATLTLAPTPSVVARPLLLSQHARHALRLHSIAMSIIPQSLCSALQDKCLNFEVHDIRA